jgi:ribosome-associated translation inhibitor RaiA
MAFVDTTPIAIRSKVRLSRELRARIPSTLARRVGHASPHIKRGTVRFEDVNGPRGGVDTVCRIKLVMPGRASVHAEDRASDPDGAFDLAAHKVRRALESKRGRDQRPGRGRSARRTARAIARGGRRTSQVGTQPSPPDRRPEKIKTSRKAPARRAAKSAARTAKRRVTGGRSRR